PGQISARRVAAVPPGRHSAGGTCLTSPSCLDSSDPQFAIQPNFTRCRADVRLAGTAFALEKTGKGVSIAVTMQPLRPRIRRGGTTMFPNAFSVGANLLLVGAVVLVAPSLAHAQRRGGGGHVGGAHVGSAHSGGYRGGVYHGGVNRGGVYHGGVNRGG